MDYNCKYQLIYNHQVLDTNDLQEVYDKIKTERLTQYVIKRDGNMWLDKRVNPFKAYQNYCEGRV